MSMRITAPLQATHFKDQAQRPLETLPLMRFRTCYLKIWYRGILNILSWRTLRKHVQEGLFDLPLHPWSRSCLPYLWRQRAQDESKQALFVNRPCSQQVVDHLCSTICLVSFSPPDFLLFIKPRIKTLKLNMSWGLHSLMKNSMSCKTYIK